MRKRIIWSGLAATAAIAIGTAVWVLNANQLPQNTSAQSVRLFENRQYRDSSFVFNWDSNAIAANSKTKIGSEFTCPSTSTEVFAFLSLRGQETNTQTGWQAFSQSAFKGQTKNVLTPNLKPAGLINGSPGAKYIRDLGGDYSLGFACTQNQGKLVDSVSYRFIHIEPYTGRWTALPEPNIKSSN